ncbi:MAG: helix-hairpin-helix domain-containing protein [Lachnospiraceae bacterium]|nr:helix-hairpin-helix domain-containing protein [Lachnospiraceae bacterium]
MFLCTFPRAFFCIFFCLSFLCGCKKDRELIELSELPGQEEKYDETGNPDATINLLSFSDETDADTPGTLGGKSDTPGAMESQAGIPGTSGSESGTQKTADTGSLVTVYICGEIVNPGVYELEAGSRIVNAVNAAGGVTGKAAVIAVNLAEPLCDGAMVYIPSITETETETVAGTDSVRVVRSSGQTQANPGQTGGNATNGSLVNINTADKTQLMTIKGIGEAKAEKIIAYREENGAFGTIEDIMKIPGIKQGMFNKIKDSICVY